MGRTIPSGISLRAVKKYGALHLSGIIRRSGENYFQHGSEVAETIQEVTKDRSLIAVATLHDLLVHPRGEALVSASPLPSEERNLVREMRGLSSLHISADTKDLDTLISAFTKDARLLILRMAHRLNDVRHLERFDEALQEKIAKETLHLYASFAGRLSFNAWRHEMEEICFQALYPDIVEDLKKKFAATHNLDQTCLELTKKYLTRFLEKDHIRVTIEFRVKSLYSTYRKMLLKKRSFEELTDRLALRLIVKSREDCYRALGVVHRVMHPIPGKLKDYIGAPKENSYQSIHTVVYPLPNVTEQPIEIQIRTERMHRQCEYGVAAHYTYRDTRYSFEDGLPRVDVIRSLELLREESRSPQQFETAMRTYFNKSRLILFDEKNNLYHIKRPASVMDFLYLIHRKKFARVKLCRVNGKVSPLERTLQDGDVVEVIFGRNRAITRNWLDAGLQSKTREATEKLLKG